MIQKHHLMSGLALSLALALTPAWAQGARTVTRGADYIVAVVNKELVTQFEVEQRAQRMRDELQRAGRPVPAGDALRQQAFNDLIDERVVVSWARDSGMKVDDQDVDRAVANIASANKMTIEQLQARLRTDGIDYQRLRANLRDQILAERVREREVPQRIKVTDSEVENYLEAERAKAGGEQTLNIAQILVTVPENASIEQVQARKQRADEALQRVRSGESFGKVVSEMSDDVAARERGGELGVRPVNRLPDLFVDAVKSLAVGAVAPQVVRSGAGFHVLKLVERGDTLAAVTQTHARHILLRPSARLSPEATARRLAELRAQIVGGKRRFEDVAREVSEDGSAAQGGDLGWAGPGMFVPEFEQAMNALQLGQVSEPIESRYGFHLIRVDERRQVTMEPRQVREQARNILREQKYGPAYQEWMDELRTQAYIEKREPPQ